MSKEGSSRRDIVKYLAAGAFTPPVAAFATESMFAGESQVSASDGPTGIFEVPRFGAVGDGRTLCTAAIQKAVDACSRNGGGKVVVPPGKYLSGPIFLASNIELEVCVGATILGAPNMEIYPSLAGRWEGIDRTIYASLLTGADLENVSITGGGILDGNGAT